jgi:thymidylate synthase
LVSAWNVTDIDEMGLPPCHWAFQCYASNEGHLDLMVHQRSWDLGLGAPFNIAQYAMLVHLIARAAGLKPRWLKFTYGDAHIYNDHAPQLMEMVYTLSTVNDRAQIVFLTPNTDIDGYHPEDIEVVGYRSNPHIPLKVSV